MHSMVGPPALGDRAIGGLNQRRRRADQRSQMVNAIVKELRDEREKVIDVSPNKKSVNAPEERELVPVDVIEEAILKPPGDHEKDRNMKQEPPGQPRPQPRHTDPPPRHPARTAKTAR